MYLSGYIGETQALEAPSDRNKNAALVVWEQVVKAAAPSLGREKVSSLLSLANSREC